MSASPIPGPAQIRLLALPEATPTAIYGLYEIFSAVGVAWAEMTGEAVEARRLDARIVARDAAPFPSPLGLPIVPHAALDEVAADAVIVTDLALAPDCCPGGRWRTEAAWVRDQFARGAAICSVCTGSVFLAEAGLLDGIEATTHWGTARLFAKHYPGVKLCPERIICPSGPEHRIITGGGAGSWTDLALYLIARFCGPAEAVRIAKIFVLGDRSEGQLPFAAMGRVAGHPDAAIGRCQEWVADHYAQPNPVARMAGFSGLPERTFKRRFKMATGYAPMDYVQALRIEEAKQMLETTADPTDAIAHAVGYQDPVFFRRLFKRMTGTTPSRYRQRYRSMTTIGSGRA
ncbi:GlxA family transcriptional regulator [Rhodoligotrophos defluvii]|uniref:GlxA family transcriptional regulator n=1 Tax=Rhodoligotrophos defluvii TaxID=2561934 RepID=UPI0010C9BDD9|nr:helix-turn-helix domain-containing protein [Rhodoligotrophos defluvii]